MLTYEYQSLMNQETATPISYTIHRTENKPTFIGWEKDIDTMIYLSHYKSNPMIGKVTINTKTDDRLDYEKNRMLTKDVSILERIEQQIFDRLYFPKHWMNENIAQPNQAAKMKSLEICKRLFTNYNLIPSRITPTKEEGVFLSYESPIQLNDKTLVIEIFNDLEVAALVNDNSTKQIIFSADIKDFDFSNAYKILVA